ncbi:MAG: Holliday junction branch migration protein RuvA [Planctomycetota bacterium]
MYERITGTVAAKTPTRLVVEVGGIGYDINVSVSTSSKITLDSAATLFLYLHVREDTLKLFGFATEDERRLFRALLTVAGIGPQTALAVLSGSSVERLCLTIINEDYASLCRIKGIGRKTAERIILELKEQVKTFAAASAEVEDTTQERRRDAAMALISLGYTHAQAQAAVEKAISKLPNATTEKLVRAALEFT